VAVVVRTGGATGLEGVRAALSLSLGDRPPALYLLADGLALLESPPESEAGRTLASLIDDVGVAVKVEAEPGTKPAAGMLHGRRADILREVAQTPFEQVF
jgi:hypothetical protein